MLEPVDRHQKPRKGQRAHLRHWQPRLTGRALPPILRDSLETRHEENALCDILHHQFFEGREQLVPTAGCLPIEVFVVGPIAQGTIPGSLVVEAQMMPFDKLPEA